MFKHSFKFLFSAALLLVSASWARADTFSIVSKWHTGNVLFGNLDSMTGNGTFTWNGSTFSNIVFSFTGSKPSDNWTATSTDGELLSGNTLLIVGNGSSDCNGTSCVGITF